MLLGLIGCNRQTAPTANDANLTTRSGADPMNAVETYLQQYQPGPLPRLFQTTRIYDRHGELLAELMDEGQRTWVSVDQVARDLLNATVATEDASFFANSGVDPVRMVGAVVRSAQEGEITSGASTITMQLARNLFLGPEQRYDQSVDRKLLEIGLAQELTQLYSKAELLEMYLNLLNYGNLAYGPEAAARIYFAKHASELTLAEASFLAGIPQQPANLDPYRNFDATKRRQRIVLDLMVRHGYLTTSEADATFAEPLALQDNRALAPNRAPHFVQYVMESLDRRFGKDYTRRAGLQITTTLDLPMQEMAQTVAAAHCRRHRAV
ncbi:MAG: transglycosylase domain-containing protein [Caldilineaceae bacterium]